MIGDVAHWLGSDGLNTDQGRYHYLCYECLRRTLLLANTKGRLYESWWIRPETEY